VEGAGGVDDVFEEEVGAAFGFAEGAVVAGQAGDGGFLGTAVGFEGSSARAWVVIIPACSTKGPPRNL
jgi:hypothetical protein